MGRDLRKLLLIDAVVLRHRVLKILLPMQGDAGHLVLIEEQEAAYPVDHGFARRARAIRKNTLEARGDGVRHGNVTDTALRLRTLYVIAHVTGSLELLVHPYTALFEVEIIHREAAELGNAEPGVQEDEEGVVIAPVVLVVRHEIEEPALLLGGKGLACDHVVHQHGGKLEVEGIPADKVVLLRHLKRGLQDPAYCVNGAVALPMDVLEVDEPFLGLERRDVANTARAELVLCKVVEYRLVASAGGLLDRGFRLGVAQCKIVDRHVVRHDVIEQVALYPLLKIPQAGADLLPLRCKVASCQGPRVDATRPPLCIDVLVAVAPVFPLRLPTSEEAPLTVLSNSHFSAPFGIEKSPDAIVRFYRTGPELLVCRVGTGSEDRLVNLRGVSGGIVTARQSRIRVRAGVIGHGQIPAVSRILAEAYLSLLHLDHRGEASLQLIEAVGIGVVALLIEELVRAIGGRDDDEIRRHGFVRVAGRCHHLVPYGEGIREAEQIGVGDGFGAELVKDNGVLARITLKNVAGRSRYEAATSLATRVLLGKGRLAGPRGAENPHRLDSAALLDHLRAPFGGLDLQASCVNVFDLALRTGVFRAGKLRDQRFLFDLPFKEVVEQNLDVAV